GDGAPNVASSSHRPSRSTNSASCCFPPRYGEGERAGLDPPEAGQRRDRAGDVWRPGHVPPGVADALALLRGEVFGAEVELAVEDVAGDAAAAGVAAVVHEDLLHLASVLRPQLDPRRQRPRLRLVAGVAVGFRAQDLDAAH